MKQVTGYWSMRQRYDKQKRSTEDNCLQYGKLFVLPLVKFRIKNVSSMAPLSHAPLHFHIQ